jgi:hypothetical protein
MMQISRQTSLNQPVHFGATRIQLGENALKVLELGTVKTLEDMIRVAKEPTQEYILEVVPKEGNLIGIELKPLQGMDRLFGLVSCLYEEGAKRCKILFEEKPAYTNFPGHEIIEKLFGSLQELDKSVKK